VNDRRVEQLRADPRTAPSGDGVLVIDEHGDRRWGKKTAQVRRQWLSNIGRDLQWGGKRNELVGR
jgi:SRSO17 transposase